MRTVAWTACILLACGAARGAITVIVDNSDTAYTSSVGGWTVGSSATDKYGTDYQFATSGAPAASFQWRPNLPFAGVWQVAVWYPAGSNRANNAPYAIAHAGGTSVVRVNQQTNGGRWNILGLYEFEAGTAGSVTLTDDANPSVVVADAVRFVSADGPPEFRGFWADGFSIGFKSTAQIDDMVRRAADGGYNAIIAEVMTYQDRGASAHGAYWHSSILPRAVEVTAGFDPLAVLCEKAHARGLEVHAWLVPFRVSTSWPPNGNSIVAAHPEWIMVPHAAMGGGVAKIAGAYMLDPGSPEVQEYLISIVRELVTNYPIDGINWDHIRYDQADAGYPAVSSYPLSSLARFRNLTGYVGTPPPVGETSWNDFRRRSIDELVRRARAEIASIANPRQPLRHTADLICFGGAPASFTSTDAYSLFQNWRLWMEMGWLDAGIPMNYKRDYDSGEYNMYRSWVLRIVNDWRYDRHMFCGQGNYLNTKADSIAQLDFIYATGADGSVNYSYNATADEDMNGIPEADWTWYPYVESMTFSEPAATPAMDWHDPASAVEGTIWGVVSDRLTGLPVEDALVTLNASGGSAYTDGNGYYVITMAPAAPAGTPYNLTAYKAGYPNSVATVTVHAGQITRQDITLGAIPGDFNRDGEVNLSDYVILSICLTISGPGKPLSPGHMCLEGSSGNGYQTDLDGDMDMDLEEVALFFELCGSS